MLDLEENQLIYQVEEIVNIELRQKQQRALTTTTIMMTNNWSYCYKRIYDKDNLLSIR